VFVVKKEKIVITIFPLHPNIYHNCQ